MTGRRSCPRCGEQVGQLAKFCPECGAPLAAPFPGREERKVVTVVFCDLVGSTAQAERLDPEDVRAILSSYHERVRADIERFGGTVEKFIGDAVMAVFGAPVAHEDDAERAVRAAIAVRETALEDGGFQVRVAVNTGEALVALGARPAEGEAMVAGDVVNTAARLQSAGGGGDQPLHSLAGGADDGDACQRDCAPLSRLRAISTHGFVSDDVWWQIVVLPAYWFAAGELPLLLRSSRI